MLVRRFMKSRFLAVHSFRGQVVTGFELAVAALVVACSSNMATSVPPAPTPEPTPTVAPTVAPTVTAVVVADQTELQLVGSQVFAALREFLAELGPRASATDQEVAAAGYIKASLQELGYDVHIQPFVVEDMALEELGLALNTLEPVEFEAIPMQGSGLGGVSGMLTSVGLVMPGDIPEDGLENRIAFAKRGVITFQSKAESVFTAGTVGLVVYNNVPGRFRGVLSTQPKYSVISMTQVDGETIAEPLTESEVGASTNLVLEELPSRNVIAERKCPGDTVVVLGGDYDTVPQVQGAKVQARLFY